MQRLGLARKGVAVGGGLSIVIVVLLVGLVVVVALIAAVVAVVMYNGLVRKRVQCENGWAQIDVQLKRRYDLVPNLVETVKGYASHERETLEAVIKARQTAIDASSIKDHAAAENMLTGALRQLMMLSEAYPDLKANQNFAKLQEELTSTENKIGFARQHYNDTVSQYNASVQMFPGNIVAGMFGFQEREFFELEDTVQREAPKVSF